MLTYTTKEAEWMDVYDVCFYTTIFTNRYLNDAENIVYECLKDAINDVWLTSKFEEGLSAYGTQMEKRLERICSIMAVVPEYGFKCNNAEFLKERTMKMWDSFVRSMTKITCAHFVKSATKRDMLPPELIDKVIQNVLISSP